MKLKREFIILILVFIYLIGFLIYALNSERATLSPKVIKPFGEEKVFRGIKENVFSNVKSRFDETSFSDGYIVLLRTDSVAEKRKEVGDNVAELNEHRERIRDEQGGFENKLRDISESGKVFGNL